MIGTQLRDTDGKPARTFTKERYKHIELGYQAGLYVNRSAGISFFIGPRLQKSIKQVLVPPKRLLGRAGAVRLRADSAGVEIMLHTPRQEKQ